MQQKDTYEEWSWQTNNSKNCRFKGDWLIRAEDVLPVTLTDDSPITLRDTIIRVNCLVWMKANCLNGRIFPIKFEYSLLNNNPFMLEKHSANCLSNMTGEPSSARTVMKSVQVNYFFEAGIDH